MYLLLFMVGAGGVVLWALYGKPEVAAIVATALITLAPAYLSWMQFRTGHEDAAAVDLDTVVGQLAVAVRNQWNDEADVRKVNNPYPLPVAWRPADDDLTEPWSHLTDMARAWPGGPPGDSGLWPPDCSGLAGADAQIGEVFSDRVPTRRLVILGEPGAGKSVLLIRLLLDLVERRTDTSPVPVLFSLASWDPHEPLKAWLAEQLRRTHPGLTTAAPMAHAVAATAADGPGDLARALLEAGRILPLLDGFDELPPESHSVALDAINRALSARQPLVLASRAAAYRDATVRLNGAAAIHLLPLTSDAAAAYLRRDAGGPHSPTSRRWDVVATHLGTATPVGEALSTPLGLFLARTIYNPRPQIAAVPAAPHPDELCDTSVYGDRAAIDRHLFRAYIPAAYTPDHPLPPNWSAAQAHRAFVYLAHFLHNHRAGSPDLAWWQLSQAVAPRTLRLWAGLVFGLVCGAVLGIAAGLTAGLTAGIAAGGSALLALGLTTGMAAALWSGMTAVHSARSTAPRVRLRWSPGENVTGVVLGSAIGIMAMIAICLTIGLRSGVMVGGALGVSTVFLAGVKTEEPELTSITGPVIQFSLDRRAFVYRTIANGVAIGIALGIARPIVRGITSGLPTGLAFGAGITMAAGAQTAWPYFVMARSYLAMRREVPRDLMAFCKDAHEHRGVLRQVGPVYQFRHIDLQRHLAQQDA
ncbi:NACHT domain-containing protein [Streptomyces sp. NPDC002888]|uniref:NACHT domain-containing protein n=1 Tax=Streptomyces sp. NPDC002888 TaxID=3364668 RepID=UPI0036B9C791